MMSPEPHRLFLHFRELPLSLRVAYTGTLLVLSVGYICSLLQMWVLAPPAALAEPRSTGDPVIP